MDFRSVGTGASSSQLSVGPISGMFGGHCADVGMFGSLDILLAMVELFYCIHASFCGSPWLCEGSE